MGGISYRNPHDFKMMVVCAGPVQSAKPFHRHTVPGADILVRRYKQRHIPADILLGVRLHAGVVDL